MGSIMGFGDSVRKAISTLIEIRSFEDCRVLGSSAVEGSGSRGLGLLVFRVWGFGASGVPDCYRSCAEV